MNVLRISENLNVMGYHPVEYIGTGCTGCGICFYVCPEPGTICVYIPATEIADDLGNTKAAKMVMAGAYIGYTGLLSLEGVLT